ncbi:cellulase family glycosylhydrolase [Spirosoma soli]|uniref:Cellulase family glycosylhydrolase n=1 Tax=Spirosoma soli TaxID=1770529 RepID=A0ABW5MBA4_9BACT
MFLLIRKRPSFIHTDRLKGSLNGQGSANGKSLLRQKVRPSLLSALLAVLLIGTSLTTGFAQQTVVEKYGQLRVQGNRIVSQSGEAVQLRGMSLYWSQWIPKFYNYNAIKWLRDDWKITVIRAAMAVDVGGYATNPAAATAEKNKVFTVIDAAVSLGLYVIVDFHVHEAQNYKTEAKAFFSEVAQKYGNIPNIIYEPWNEPYNTPAWATVIKPYHEEIISTIRQYDPDNIIICGTRTWSQNVDEPAADPINEPNIAYTLHYYANTHKQWLRDRAQAALDKGIALFVTEYGTTDASGNGFVNEVETRAWWAFLDKNKIGHANWSVADIGESSAALVRSGNGVNVSADGGWPLSQIKQSGQLVRNELRSKSPFGAADFTITGATPVNCQTVTGNPAMRRVSFTPQYNGQTDEPISFSVVNEMAPTTAAGPYTLNLYTDNPTIRLEAKQGENTASFAYDWLSVCSSTTPPSASLVISGVTMVSCQTLTADMRRLSFTPQYSGVTSGTAAPAVSFSVVNEMMPTTAPGPYTLNLYTDNPTITLKAQQGAKLASYSYNWVDACTYSGARRGAEPLPALTVTVLGNPVVNESVEVEVRGAANQPLRLQVVDAGGRNVNLTTIESAREVERVRLGLGRSTGTYLLRVSTPTQQGVTKLIKP